MPHELNPTELFEPTAQMKRWWRYTRKASFRAGDIELPGLFQTVGSDAPWFVVVILLELFGLYMLRTYGVQLPYVAGLFLGDVIFAICRHIPVGRICQLRNELVITEDPNQRAKILDQIGKLKLVMHFFSFLIIGIAAFKVLGYWALAGEFTGPVLLVLLSYMVAAVIHITRTGYFVFYILVDYFWRRDRKIYLRSAGPGAGPTKTRITHYRDYIFNPSVEIEEINVHKHELKKETGTASKLTYMLRTCGVLTDHDLQAFIATQRYVQQQDIIAKEGVKVQLQILGTDAIQAGVPVQ